MVHVPSVQTEEHPFVQPAKQQAQGIGHDRVGGPRRLHRGQAQRLHEETGEDDEDEQRQREVEPPVGIQPVRLDDVAPVDRQPQPHQHEERGQVKHDFFKEVQVPLEQLGIEDQLEHIGVERSQHRADEEQGHAPEDAQVHGRGVALAQDSDLSHAVFQRAHRRAHGRLNPISGWPARHSLTRWRMK